MENASIALDFDSFINESKVNGKVEILVVSEHEEEGDAPVAFRNECKKRKIPFNSININRSRLEKVLNGHAVISVDDNGKESKVMIRPESTVIIPRRGVVKNASTRRFLKDLEDSRYFCLNTLESFEVCESKFITSQILESEGLPVPRYELISKEEDLERAVEAVGGKFPVVIKLLSGTQGIGVSIVDSFPSLKSVYQTIAKLSTGGEILIQERIDSNYDLRVQVIVKKFSPLSPSDDNYVILGAMKRGVVEKDFRTNYSLGGKVSGAKISDEIKEIAYKAASAVGCHWCGVDIMVDSKTKKPYILEVNSSPGIEGISKALGKPIVDEIVDYIEDKNNWDLSKMEIGYLETLEIPKIGKLIGKFDTGNGSTASSLHTDEVKVEGKKVKWKIGKVQMESPLVGYSETVVGKDVFKRPIVKIDLVFNGVKLSDVEVGLTDRASKSTPFLANRKLMDRMGVVVNPHRAFMRTEKMKGYSPSEAQKDPQGGIEFQ